MAQNSCGCGGKAIMLFACSGAADVGEIADQTARKLSRETCAQMSCLAGVGAGISGFIESAKGADTVIVIDGCPVACGKKALDKNKVANFKHLRVTDCGLEKGKSPANKKNLEKAYAAAKKLL